MLRLAGKSLAPALVAAGATIALLVGCGGSGGAAPSGQTAISADQSTSGAKFAGIAAVPSKPAPPLALKDSLGRPINLDQYRGKAVFITFIYDHCPDTCPLIVGNLHTALARLGPAAKKVQLVAVSVDPRGDTPRTVRAFLQAHGMTGRIEYLLGSRPQLENVWRAWNIVSKSGPAKAGPAAVEHSALIYGISASGKITTLYPSNFRPGQIVHDVPILASE
ncbi:MAG TPA: SCO family protein [Solirubrobacterales bacterium]|nr:SCO family protein [Solirubrobacterales bacterium]